MTEISPTKSSLSFGLTTPAFFPEKLPYTKPKFNNAIRNTGPNKDHNEFNPGSKSIDENEAKFKHNVLKLLELSNINGGSLPGRIKLFSKKRPTVLE